MSGPAIFLTGANGQVGWELRSALAPLGTVLSHDRSTLDLSDLAAVRNAIRRAEPAVIVNAAAYTQVDRAESEPDMARRINSELPAVLADEARRAGALLVHYSTDYVFDGNGTRPYREEDAPAPATVYGRTKLDGDLAVLNSGATANIFRVGWVYGLRGTSFLRTIIRLASERPELRIVADQRGGPTWSRAIASATAAALRQVLAARAAGKSAPAATLFHMAPPDATTWYEFAVAIVEAAIPPERRPPVRPIATSEYPTPARRPRWSVLDATRLRAEFGLVLPSWREQLASCLASEGSS